MNNGFPQWIKIIAQIGFPIGIAIYVIALLQPVIMDTHAKIDEHIRTVSRAIEQSEEQTHLLRIICHNTALNDFQKANCDSKP